jgi:hypothetical protein
MGDLAQMLDEILSWCETHHDEEHSVPEDAMRDIRNRYKFKRSLSDKQIAFVRSVYEKLFDAPQYDNAWSAGKVPRGEALATPVPEVLKTPLPLRPPGRA